MTDTLDGIYLEPRALPSDGIDAKVVTLKEKESDTQHTSLTGIAKPMDTSYGGSVDTQAIPPGKIDTATKTATQQRPPGDAKVDNTADEDEIDTQKERTRRRTRLTGC